MHLTTLRTTGWRNLADANLELSPRVNVLVGGNGQGKTNFLEAVQYLALGRSHRGSRDDEIVRFGGDHFFVRGVGLGDGGQALSIEAGFTPPRSKRIKVDGHPVPRLTDLMGILACVSFGPEDAELARGAPQLRRRFVDYAIAETSRTGLDLLGEYRRVVQQRATLLRDPRGGAESERALAVWDDEQVRLGTELVARRADALADLAPRAAAAYASLGSGLRLRLRYAVHATGRSYEAGAAAGGDPEGPGWRTGAGASVGASTGAGLGELQAEITSGRFAAEFRERMRQRRAAEKARGLSLVGPHRDDFELWLDDHEVRRFGSQGQGRAAAIALKMAQAEFIGARRGGQPVVVLDDVFAELDEARAGALWSVVCERHQTFLAVPRRSDAQLGHGDAVFRVEAGVLHREA